MKILFFHPLTGYLWRGIERNVVSLASTMEELREHVSILTIRHRERALLDALRADVRLVEVPYSRYYTYSAASPFFAAHLVRHHYDAIIVFFGGFGIGPSLALARLTRQLPVYLYLGYPLDVAHHRYTEIERWGIQRYASGIWAHGDHVAAAASERFGRPVTSLPTGVDPERFCLRLSARESVRARLGIKADAPVILTVCALEQRKGIQHVLEALPAVRYALPDVKYVIVGSGNYASEIRQRIDRLRLEDTVIMLGAQTGVEELYQAADIFCLMARGEAGPIVAYEALASRLPLVTLDGPHLRPHLDSSVAELLPDVEPTMLASSLVSLVVDPTRRKSMGLAGERLVKERYSYRVLAQRILETIKGRPQATDSMENLLVGRDV